MPTRLDRKERETSHHCWNSMSRTKEASYSRSTQHFPGQLQDRGFLGFRGFGFRGFGWLRESWMQKGLGVLALGFSQKGCWWASLARRLQSSEQHRKQLQRASNSRCRTESDGPLHCEVDFRRYDPTPIFQCCGVAVHREA